MDERKSRRAFKRQYESLGTKIGRFVHFIRWNLNRIYRHYPNRLIAHAAVLVAMVSFFSWALTPAAKPQEHFRSRYRSAKETRSNERKDRVVFTVDGRTYETDSETFNTLEESGRYMRIWDTLASGNPDFESYPYAQKDRIVLEVMNLLKPSPSKGYQLSK